MISAVEISNLVGYTPPHYCLEDRYYSEYLVYSYYS